MKDVIVEYALIIIIYLLAIQITAACTLFDKFN